MRFQSFGLLAAIFLALSSLSWSTVSNVHAIEQQITLTGLLSPVRSSLRNVRDFLQNIFHVDPDQNEELGDDMRAKAYEMFMRMYNKTYSSRQEIMKRMRIFSERRKQIEQSKLEFAQGRSAFTMQENAFVDWDESELKKLTGVDPPKDPNELMPEEHQALLDLKRQLRRRRRRRSIEPDEFSDQLNNDTWHELMKEPDDYFEDSDYEANLNVMAPGTLPASKDWRVSGCIEEPINQMNCGCCYAIATMGVIESMRCLNERPSAILSPQHIVDCATTRAGYQNYGCNGGWPTRVLKYLDDTGVAVRESCYPFEAKERGCRLRRVSRQRDCIVSSSPTDTELRYKVLNSERAILHHVAYTGPVVTVVRATQKFLFYSSGIFDDPECSRRRDDVDHAITIVGYGSQNGLDFWIIKNSWGTRWGENGYGKYLRGKNACSIGYWGWVITS